VQNIEIDTFFDDKLVHIEISAPMGVGGATYFVTINNYHNGCIVKTADGWRIHLHLGTILQGDDTAVIVDLIESQLNG
jgi:hypothetical protein